MASNCEAGSSTPAFLNLNFWNNASVHFDKTDNVWESIVHDYYQSSGILFELVNQPARSPDLNICDLSICNVLQNFQWQYDGQLKMPNTSSML